MTLAVHSIAETPGDLYAWLDGAAPGEAVVYALMTAAQNPNGKMMGEARSLCDRGLVLLTQRRDRRSGDISYIAVRASAAVPPEVAAKASKQRKDVPSWESLHAKGLTAREAAEARGQSPASAHNYAAAHGFQFKPGLVGGKKRVG
jgi:hypothetical protein